MTRSEGTYNSYLVGGNCRGLVVFLRRADNAIVDSSLTTGSLSDSYLTREIFRSKHSMFYFTTFILR